MSDFDRPSISEVFDHYGLRVIGRGSGWTKAQCPSLEHEDANPSASINEDIGKWNCFSCGRSGDSLDVVMEREGFARITDALQFSEKHFATGGGTVRGPGGRGSGVSGRSSAGKRARNWSPPWRLS